MYHGLDEVVSGPAHGNAIKVVREHNLLSTKCRRWASAKPQRKAPCLPVSGGPRLLSARRLSSSIVRNSVVCRRCSLLAGDAGNEGYALAFRSGSGAWGHQRSAGGRLGYHFETLQQPASRLCGKLLRCRALMFLRTRRVPGRTRARWDDFGWGFRLFCLIASSTHMHSWRHTQEPTMFGRRRRDPHGPTGGGIAGRCTVRAGIERPRSIVSLIPNRPVNMCLCQLCSIPPSDCITAPPARPTAPVTAPPIEIPSTAGPPRSQRPSEHRIGRTRPPRRAARLSAASAARAGWLARTSLPEVTTHLLEGGGT
jgi:hypothetical protein